MVDADTPKRRVLIVDDEPRYVRLIAVNLEASGYETLAARDGRIALDLAAAQKPDLVLLDIGLPAMDGFEVCRRIREFSASPIIMLTAKAGEADKVRGLDAGADDYLTKPFDTMELLARLRVAFRHRSGRNTESVTAGPITIDLARHRVTLYGSDVRLTPREFALVLELARNADRVVTHQRLLRRVWGAGHVDDVEYLRVAMRALRQKLEPASNPPRIFLNEPGIGYRLATGELTTALQRERPDS